MDVPEPRALDSSRSSSWRKCEHCDITFTTERASIQHTKRERHRQATGESLEKTAACRACGRRFNRASDRLRHESNQSCRDKCDTSASEEDSGIATSSYRSGPGFEPGRTYLISSSRSLEGVSGGSKSLRGFYAGEEDVRMVRDEIQTVRETQRQIENMILELRERNDMFYRQAHTFASQHDRHQNAINATLTFLATFYRNA